MAPAHLIPAAHRRHGAAGHANRVQDHLVTFFSHI
jgi:hypothetical protein